MDSLTRLLILAAALIAVALVPASATAKISKQKVYLSNGFDGDQIRPEYQTLLGPNQVLLVDLEWSSWGGKKATGRGTWGRHDCMTGCGSGPLIDRAPVRIVLSKPRPCKRDSSRVYYRARKIEFTGRVPEGMKRRTVSRFPCWDDLMPKPDFSVRPRQVHGLGAGVEDIAIGFSHACAVRDTGAVLCWGDNYQGALGDGTQKQRWRPVAVRGLEDGATAISAGDWSTCAVTAAGGAACWGSNDFGQLGDGTEKERSRPVAVQGLDNGVRAISVGGSFACAVTDAGAVKCWGDGTKVPATVPGLESGVVAVSVGDIFNCAVTDEGAVKCWGYSEDGLGDGVSTDSSTPVQVSGLESGATAVSVGQNHACAVTASGGVRCWGWNGDGELGDGTRQNRSTPVAVSGLDGGVTAIAAGSFHTCATLAAGGVKCWGYNLAGEIGLSPITQRAITPIDVEGAAGTFPQVSAGHLVTCLISEAGGASCWGANESGQLGISARP